MMATTRRAKPTSGRVARFYSEAGGENMFDARYLTPAIRKYLADESKLLSEIVATEGYTHLIEVGCGYGRYLKWALTSGIHYDGIDLVDWMTEFGQVRIEQLQQVRPDLHRAIHNIGVEALPELLFERRRLSGPVRTVAFFPFNCFGNLENLSQSLDALAGLGCDVFIATYTSEEGATDARLRYYDACGYRLLRWQDSPEGALITSMEGFRSLAFAPEYLDVLMRSGNFEPAGVHSFAGIGRGHLYRCLEAPTVQLTPSPGPERREYTRRSQELRGWITVVQEDVEGIPDASHLLSMDRDSVTVVNCSLDGALVLHRRSLPAGSLIRLRIQASHRADIDLELFAVVQRTTVVEEGLREIALKIVRLSSTQRLRLRHLLSVL